MKYIQPFSGKRLTVFLALWIIFNACEESSIIELKLKHKQVLVCTGFIGNGIEPMVYMQLTHDPLQGNADNKMDARVRIILSGGLEERLVEMSDNFFKGRQKGIVGQTYSIVAETTLYGKIHSAQITVPERVPIVGYMAETTTKGDMKINVLFNDPEEKNYYGYKVLYFDQEGNYLNDDTENILFYPSQIFDDAMAVNGKIEHTVTIQHFYLRQKEIDHVKIILYHLDNHTWYYYKSLYESEGSLGDIWLEPTMVYSNMQNGIGVFGAFASDTILVPLHNKIVKPLEINP